MLRNHWPYKLGAFFIVFLLWLDLTAGERQSKEVLTRLVIDVQDSAWVLLDAPREVATTFQGRKLLDGSLDFISTAGSITNNNS